MHLGHVMDFHSNGGIKTKCRRDGGALQSTTAPLPLPLPLPLPSPLTLTLTLPLPLPSPLTLTLTLLLPTPTRIILRGNAILKLEKITGSCSGLADPASHQDEAIL